MLFNSLEFIFLFLPLNILIFLQIGKLGNYRFAILFLITTSLFFYAWWNPSYLVLLIFSVIFNYFVGLALNKKIKNSIHKKLTLIIGVIVNLALIGYFKYTNFLASIVSDITGINFHLDNIILPLAISFFTFQQISYLVDAYKGEIKEYNFLDYCLFVTFFPQLIAGPIVHHKDIIFQFENKDIYRYNPENIAIGITIFSIGLFKKVVFADTIAVYATPTFNAASQGIAPTFISAWIAALAYTLQLYFDFSGYSDMAIGIARMFGIKLPINFNSPYKAISIIDFWRRWHITLSNFLRDYLYIPLGGSRQGKLRRNFNLLITMLLGGIWHGAGWTFVFWGGLHGIYLIINHQWRSLRKSLGHDLNNTNWLDRGFGWLLTFLAVVISWVIFRAESMNSAFILLQGMIGLNGISISEAFSYQSVFWIISLLIIALFTPNTQEWMTSYNPALNHSGANLHLWKRLQWRPNQVWAMVTGTMTVIALLKLTKVSEFLYFQF